MFSNFERNMQHFQNPNLGLCAPLHGPCMAFEGNEKNATLVF